jgi:hypothetical protein
MHRLQISLTQSQLQYLADRARREGSSIAELIRRLVQRESEAFTPRSKDSLFEIVGMGKDPGSLIDGIPVSEQPDIYIYEKAPSYPSPTQKRSKKGRSPK